MVLPSLPAQAGGVLPEGRRRLFPALLRLLPLALLVLTMSVGATGCTARLTAPAEPSSPVPALLLDHGRHASLVLPGADSGAVRYSFGDWRYYAEGETGLGSGLKALFWPTPSALGRRELDAEPREAAVRGALRVWSEAVLTLQVEEDRVRAFRTRLDSLFLEGQEKAFRYNADYDLEFARHPATYWFGHNSNHMLAEWLRELGVSVKGPTMFSSWKLESLQAPADSVSESPHSLGPTVRGNGCSSEGARTFLLPPPAHLGPEVCACETGRPGTSSDTGDFPCNAALHQTQDHHCIRIVSAIAWLKAGFFRPGAP